MNLKESFEEILWLPDFFIHNNIIESFSDVECNIPYLWIRADA
jgi:hypothetical protein